MSDPKYPPPPGYSQSGGFPPPSSGSDDYPKTSGFPPPPSGGFPPPSSGGFPPPSSGGYSPPPNYSPPSGYSSSGNYQPPSDYGYRPQQQVYAQPYPTMGGMVAATFGQRLIALILDGIIAGIAWGIIQAVLPRGVVSILSWSVVYAAYAVLTSLYFGGATTGKMLLGLRVVDRNGNVPELVPLILRYSIGYWISWFIAGLGFLWAAFDPQQQALHDKIARTYVVTNSGGGTRRY